MSFDHMMSVLLPVRVISYDYIIILLCKSKVMVGNYYFNIAVWWHCKHIRPLFIVFIQQLPSENVIQKNKIIYTQQYISVLLALAYFTTRK